MTTRLKVLTALCAFTLFAAGCGQKSTFTPAPRSTESTAQVYADASAWAARAPDRYFLAVAATGSMEPVINEHSVLLMVKYTGQTLPNGSVISYYHSPELPNVTHVIADQNDTHVYISGYANKTSDGWFPKTSILGFVVGQLYTQ